MKGFAWTRPIELTNLIGSDWENWVSSISMSCLCSMWRMILFLKTKIMTAYHLIANTNLPITWESFEMFSKYPVKYNVSITANKMHIIIATLHSKYFLNFCLLASVLSPLEFVLLFWKYKKIEAFLTNDNKE